LFATSRLKSIGLLACGAVLGELPAIGAGCERGAGVLPSNC